MSGFSPKDFGATYEKHRDELERARRVAKLLLDLWVDATGWFPKGTSRCYEIQSLIEDATRIGYEAALGMPHKSKDYDIDEVTLGGYGHKCDFCKHQYFVYNCEEECARTSAGLSCKLTVKENLAL